MTLEKKKKNFEFQLAILKNLRNFWILRVEEITEEKIETEENLQVILDDFRSVSERIDSAEAQLKQGKQNQKKDALKRSFQKNDGAFSWFKEEKEKSKSKSFVFAEDFQVNKAELNEEDKIETDDGFNSKKGSFLSDFFSFS